MSRTMLIVVVGLSGYAAFNILCSLAVALAWRLGRFDGSALPAAERARRLTLLRATPSVAAAFISLVVIVPAFALFEPHHDYEPVGPILPTLAAIAIAQLITSLSLAAATAFRTRSVARRWLRAGTPLEVQPPAGVPAYAIDSLAPIVALVGVVWPKLIAARAVIDACTRQEMTTIVAHERGHLYARDNMKRWLMTCAPDALRWTPMHHEICAAWHDAAEDAADDVATGGDAVARIDLATLLVKIARLHPDTGCPAAAVSPFVQPQGLARRVRRLLDPAHATTHSTSIWPWAVLAGVALITTLASTDVMSRVFVAVEALVAFGR